MMVLSIKCVRREVDELGNPEETEEMVFPGPNDELLETDLIHVIGKNESIDEFRQLLGGPR